MSPTSTWLRQQLESSSLPLLTSHPQHVTMLTHVMAYPTEIPSPHPTLSLMALGLIPTHAHLHHPDSLGKAASKFSAQGNQTLESVRVLSEL